MFYLCIDFLIFKTNKNMFGFLKNLGQTGPTSEELKQYKADGATFLDVRSPGEYAEGHIPGAPNIPVQVIDQQLEAIKKMQQPIITYCRSGGRAGSATNYLKKNGIESFNAGGFDSLSTMLNS